jgi:hypothetical protein
MTADLGDIPFGTGLRRIRMVVDLLRLSGEEAVDAIAPLVHPQMRVLAAPGIAPAGGYESREEFLGYFGEASARGILIQPDASEILVSPSGAVLVTGSLRIAGPDGIDEVPSWFVYTFREGLIGSLETYLDREMAEKAAGLD